MFASALEFFFQAMFLCAATIVLPLSTAARNFATYIDANGDGISDFQGLARRRDYLQGIGVTAPWQMPFQSSFLSTMGMMFPIIMG